MSSDFNNVLGGLAREREARAAVRAGGEMSLGRKASGAPTAPPTALKREVVDLTADPDDDKPTKRAKSGASCTTSPISSSSAVSNSVGQPNATIGYAPLVDWRTARPWFCFGCMTPNPADANLACINCQQVKPEMQAWITSQTRLIESFWSPDIVKGSFGKVGMQYGNRGRIRNGNLDPDTACSVYGNSEHVGFGKEPLPLAGDTIAVLRPGRMYPDIMISPTTAKIYKTPATVSNARIERIDYGGPRPFYVFRNADGRNGLEMARLFEQVFGVDILSAEPLGIHCGALGTGSACADKFQKVFPRGMGLDYSRGLVVPANPGIGGLA